MINHLKPWIWWHPIKLKPRQKSKSNYDLLKSLTGYTQKYLYTSIRKYWLNPSDYDDVSAYIYMYMEKRIKRDIRAKRLEKIKV